MNTKQPEPFWRKPIVRNAMGQVPLAVELYWQVYQHHYHDRYILDEVEKHSDEMKRAVRAVISGRPKGKKIFLFAAWSYWIDFCAVLGMALSGLRYQVTLGYFPYARFQDPIRKFDLRLHSLYSNDRLEQLKPFLHSVSLLKVHRKKHLPDQLQEKVNQITEYDTQYILQTEEVDSESDLFQLRSERNQLAAGVLLNWLEEDPPDCIVIPNGSIMELAVAFQVAHYLNIPTTTFEFSLNKEEIWLSQDVDVMQQNTDAIWKQRGSQPLTVGEKRRIRDLEDARWEARTYGKSDWLWQLVPTHGEQEVRRLLNLDDRPIALIATNVLGDSLTINRNLFASSMTEWVGKTVRYFSDRPEVQVIVRIHPGERISTGPSLMNAVTSALNEIPENIHLIGPLEKINTYDLMKISNIGMVYTTTAGLELAMNNVPVIVAGKTHYRNRGFTFDPNTWNEYFKIIDELVAHPQRLTPQQVELAWRYAYLYFFVYTLPFPWKLVNFNESFTKWPLERVLGTEGQARFGKIFQYLAGEPINWKSI